MEPRGPLRTFCYYCRTFSPPFLAERWMKGLHDPFYCAKRPGSTGILSFDNSALLGQPFDIS